MAVAPAGRRCGRKLVRDVGSCRTRCELRGVDWRDVDARIRVRRVAKGKGENLGVQDGRSPAVAVPRHALARRGPAESEVVEDDRDSGDPAGESDVSATSSDSDDTSDESESEEER